MRESVHSLILRYVRSDGRGIHTEHPPDDNKQRNDRHHKHIKQNHGCHCYNGLVVVLVSRLWNSNERNREMGIYVCVCVEMVAFTRNFSGGGKNQEKPKKSEREKTSRIVWLCCFIDIIVISIFAIQLFMRHF